MPKPPGVIVASVENGKYVFRVEDGRITVTRHGVPWLNDEDFPKGSKALIALIGELEEYQDADPDSPPY